MNTEHRARFVFAGNATFTLTSGRTGQSFTYRIREGKPLGSRAPKLFASVLTGPDNTRDYTYLGIVERAGDRAQVVPTRASTIDVNAPSFRALEWFLQHVDSPAVEVRHMGRCGRCGRALTVPSSIDSGLGPECAGKI
jgi:hypothetical protein